MSRAQVIIAVGPYIYCYFPIASIRLYSTPMDTNCAGSIRAAGGAFGKLEAAREEEYFLRKVSLCAWTNAWMVKIAKYFCIAFQQHEQLKKLQDDQISQEIFHQKQIADLELALSRHKESLKKLRSP